MASSWSSASTTDQGKGSSPPAVVSQLNSLVTKYEAAIKAQPDKHLHPALTDAFGSQLAALLTPLTTLTASSPFIAAHPSSPALLDALLAAVTRFTGVRSALPIVTLLIRVLTSLTTASKGYARTLAHKPVTAATVAVMKTYGKYRKVLTECLHLLMALHKAQPDHATAATHPLTRGKLHGVTLYRRLFDILANSTFRSYRSLLTPTLDLLLIMLKLSIQTGKKGGPIVEEVVEKRLKFALPTLMELAYLLTFGTTTLQRSKGGVKKVVRPRTPATHMFKALVLVVSRLSSLSSLLPHLVRLGAVEWGLEVLKETRDHVASVQAAVQMLLNISRETGGDGCNTLWTVVAGKEDDCILRYLAAHVDAKHPLLFRQTRDLLWQLALFDRQRRGRLAPADIFHYGYNLLDASYFGASHNDYHVKFEFLDHQKHQRIHSLHQLVQQEESSGMDVEALVEEAADSEDESDGLESDAEEGGEAEMEEEEDRRWIDAIEGKNAAAEHETYDSEGEGDDEDEANKSTPHSWIEVKLSEQAVQASAELKGQDVEEEEKEEAAMSDEPAEDSSGTDGRGSQQQRESEHHIERRKLERAKSLSTIDHDLSLADFLPERWDKKQADVRTRLERMQREVVAAKTNSVRQFINHHADEQPLERSASAASSSYATPIATPTSASGPSLPPPAHPTLLNSSMFSREASAAPPASAATYPEPSYVSPASQALRDVNHYWYERDEEKAKAAGFTPRVVYDRNVLGALQSMTGTFVADPLTVFNADPTLSSSSPPSLSFDSRFESGNLCRATQLTSTHYRLELSNDINTNAHTQWFLFRIANMQPGVQYRFDVVNLEKKTSAFHKGMKPTMYSEREAERSGLGWCRALMAEKVYYFPNHRVMQPRMSKSEITARTPKTSLVHLLSAAQSRRASTGGMAAVEVKADGGSGAVQPLDGVDNGGKRRGYVDVEQLVLHGSKRSELSGELADEFGVHPTVVRGEGGAILTSFLSSETPLERSFSMSHMPTSTAVSAPITPTSGAITSSGPSLNRTLSSPIHASPPPAAPSYHSTLSFCLSFVHERDIVYLAHFYPYTYTFLRHQLRRYQEHCSHMLRQPLCYTRLGNVCELLTITDLSSTTAPPIASRPIVLLSSRVHPGETNASWALDGLLAFITSDLPAAVQLRQWCVFKIVPMLNIDGVVEGNYRTNLSGLDLNRYWAKTSALQHPTIHFTKQLMFEMRQSGQPLSVVIDWHGHSTMSSTGLYGCNESESSIKPRPPTDEEQHDEEQSDWMGVVPPQLIHLRERLLPMLVQQRGTSVFDYSECTYNVSAQKAGSARVVAWQGLRLNAVYTLETTFYGCDEGKLRGLHWNVEHYRRVGRSVALACYDLFNPDRTACQQAFAEVQRQYKINPRAKRAA